MDLALQIINLLNATAPGVANLVLMIKRADGTVSVVQILDEADAKFQDNMKQIQDWLNAHPK